jgi:hypothetical protein
LTGSQGARRGRRAFANPRALESRRPLRPAASA